jgi:hypothetical protein
MMTKFGYNIIERLCTACGKHKPVRGGTTYPRFRCAECKTKKKEDKK